MKTSIIRRLRFFLLLTMLTACTAVPRKAEAAEKPAMITRCYLKSKKTVKVQVSIPKTSAVKGSKVYLFALPLNRTTLKKTDKPLAVKKKKKKVTFTVKLNRGSDGTLLYSKFVVARKSEKKYKAVSTPRYISNPWRKASYTTPFPTAASKKGLQANAGMLEDAAQLGVQHAAFNIDLAALLAPASSYNNSASYSYKYKGKKYWFLRSAVDSYDAQVKSLTDSGATVSAILLLSWRDDLKHLIYPSGRSKGHSFYAWNTKSAGARKTFAAALSFLQSRYSGTGRGRIVNWILGNEVDNYHVYNYAGNLKLSKYASIYAQAFLLTYQTVTSVYSNARVYISLDHLWNYSLPGTFTARAMLDKFAAKLTAYGDIPWHLAYHPYSSPLTEPRFWTGGAMVTDTIASPVINMANLSILTSYIRTVYGPQHRIILSEQGYTSVQNGKNVEAEQAAAIAYSYLLTEADDMVDSFIMNRHVDHRVEVNQGLNLGLWTTTASSYESADTAKLSYNVYKYMDTSRSPEVTSFALQVIGVASWNELLQNYGPSLYLKSWAAAADSVMVAGYQNRVSLADSWTQYGAVSSSSAVSGGLKLVHSQSRNRNVVWGAVRTEKADLSACSAFFSTVTVTGAGADSVVLNFRFRSGSSVLDSQITIPAGREVKTAVDLSEWAGKNAVTQIQITASPSGSASWKKGASMSVTYAGAA